MGCELGCQQSWSVHACFLLEWMFFPGFPLHRHLTSCFIPISASYVILWQHTWFPQGTNPFWSLTRRDLLRPLSAGMSVHLWLLSPGCNPCRMLLLPCSLCDSPQSVAALSLPGGLSLQPTEPPQRQQRLLAHGIRCAAWQGSLDGLWSPLLLVWGLSPVLELTLSLIV